MIDIAFGGMVAEELFFGECSTGWRATCSPPRSTPVRWWASSGWAPRWSRWRPSSTRAGASSARSWPTSRAGAEVEALLDDSKSSVTRMLDEHRHVVEALRDALLVRSELIGDEILEVIGRAVADPDILPGNLRDRPPGADGGCPAGDGTGRAAAADTVEGRAEMGSAGRIDRTARAGPGTTIGRATDRAGRSVRSERPPGATGMRDAVTGPRPAPDGPQAGQLGTADLTASTVANIGPGIDFYFGFGVIAVTAGVGAPLTILAAAVAVFLLAQGVAEFTRAEPSAGSFIEFVESGLGPVAGIATAVLVAVGYTIAMAGVFTMSGGFLALTLSHYGSPPPWGPLTLVITLAALALMVRGIRLSTAAVAAAVVLQVAIMVVACA